MASSSIQSNSMASSSSFSSRKGWTYDVFLSFRGDDTRYNFVDHLHAALTLKGIHTFKDDNMLGGGQPISEELVKAIKDSRFAVVVFSKNYANSSWCLEELSTIMECHDPIDQMGLKVLPVFYHVDPSDVRKQTGDFATAFKTHEDKFKGEMDKVDKWRDALTAAASLSGQHILPHNGGEATFISKIVEEILADIQPRGGSGKNHLIGIEPHIDKLISLLKMKATEEVRFVGIWGMGGIGKTTIARALFNRIAHKFQGSSLVKNVREKSEKNICALQEKILNDILGARHEFTFQDPEVGAETIQKRCCNKKVLLVLDDVNDVKQLEFLAEIREWFGPGSRIIITTRDQHVLSYVDEKYTPALISGDQAVELFSRHAFYKRSPPEGYEELSIRAIHHAGGLPLALKVLGSFFRGRKANVWESALTRLAKTQDNEIFMTLKLSFDDLGVSEQKIFLDIACFYKGKDVDDVTRILDSFGFDPVIGISVLVEKSLITISSNNTVDMHDLIQEMGWKVVHESFPNSRLLLREKIHDLINNKKELDFIEGIVVPRDQSVSPNVFKRMQNRLAFCCFPHDEYHESFPNSRLLLREKIHDLINENKELESIEGIVVSKDQSVKVNDFRRDPTVDELKPRLSADIFKSMKKLRLLRCYGKFTYNEPTFLPDELRWFCWRNYPFSSVPVAHMSKLVGLDIKRGKIEHLWQGKKIMLQNLKFINLKCCFSLTRFPDVSGAPNIESLDLSHCLGLVEIDESVGSLKKLRHLDMSYCVKLKCLPSMLYMESLEALNLFHCESLERIPEFSPCMVKLTFLNLDECESLKNIPNSICELKCLNTLRLDYLAKLPDDFQCMKSVESLTVEFRKSIDLHALTHYSFLKTLRLQGNFGENDFPENLHGLSSLEKLHIRENSELIQLPESISHLSSLKHLHFYGCSRLQTLHGLPPGIQALTVLNCESLERMEDLSKQYKCLYKVDLSDCPKLLEDEENGRYLDKMLDQSFLQKWAAVDGGLIINIPGSNIPSWFEEQQDGCKIALKLGPKWQTEIIGFALCCVSGTLEGKINLRFENDEMLVPKWEAININETEEAVNSNLWTSYIPFRLFEQFHGGGNDNDFEGEDWFHITKGNLVFDIPSYLTDVVRCGAKVIYKEDVATIQQTIPSISSFYWSWKLTNEFTNSFTCREYS